MDCACVIHGTTYDWIYVEKLYNMLLRQNPTGIRMHVYTEPERNVPAHMIKHCLEDWPGVSGPRKSWWYKLQMFNPKHFDGTMLYLDLDVIVYNDLTWITNADTNYFWTIRDFKYLQRPGINSMNSSLMYWNVGKFGWVWDKFKSEDILNTTRRYPGDQDYLQQVIDHNQRRFFEDRRVQSWRWQAHDGGYNFRNRSPNTPGTGTQVNPDASVLIFHGKPKPHEITDPVVTDLWQ